MAQSRVTPIVRTTLAGSSLTSSFQPINPNGLDGACFSIAIANTTTAAVDISYDGVNTHDVVLTGATTEVLAQTNAQPNGWVALFQKGLIVYVKGASSAGNIYLSGYYVHPSSTSQLP
jgi:hypothetical protein